MFNLFRKTMYDKRAFIVGWSLGLAFVGYLMLIFFPAFHNDSGLDKLVGNLPPALKGLVGDLNNLKNVSSYIGSQLFDIRIPLFVSVISIILAVGLTVGEEEKGYIRTLLALPISRTKVLFSKFAAIIVIGFIVTIATDIGVWFGSVIIKENLDWTILLHLSLMMWLLTVCTTTIVMGIGLATGKRGLTMGSGVVIAVGSFILTTFAKSVDWLQSYEHISLFHYFPAADIANNGIALSDVIVLASITIVSLIIGIIFFRMRDVR